MNHNSASCMIDSGEPRRTGYIDKSMFVKFAEIGLRCCGCGGIEVSRIKGEVQGQGLKPEQAVEAKLKVAIEHARCGAN